MSRRTGSALRALGAIAGLAAATLAAAAGQLRATADVDRSELAQDETLTLELRVEAREAPAVSLPTAGLDFDVVSRAQSSQTSVDLSGGGLHIRRVLVYQLVLAPRRTGALTIPPIEITAGGERTTTAPIPIQVLPPGSGGGGAPPAAPGPAPGRPAAPGGPRGLLSPGGPGGSWHGWERDLRLSVEVDRSELFLGDQLTASVWLLSPVPVLAYEGYRPPLYDGFWAEELETPRALTFELRRVGGVPVRAYLLQRLALFPTRAGRLELGTFQADVVVRLAPQSPFDPFPDVQRVNRRSAPIAVVARPLPAGAPPGFSSSDVGAIALGATLSDRSAAVGQPVTVRLTAEGEGNVKSWSPPPLPAVAGLRAFAPTTGDKVAPRGGRLAGTRTVETVIVADAPGTYTVPPIAWPTFDPRAGAYRVLTTPPLTLEVRPAAPGSAPAPAAPGENRVVAGLRPIRADGALERRRPPPWDRPAFPLLVALPALGYAALRIGARLRERRAAAGGARRAGRAGAVARRRLAAATRLAAGDDAPAFFAEVGRALSGYCADKLGRPAEGLTRDELARALVGAGAHPPAIRALAVALDASDAGRFGGAASREEVLALAGRAMEILEEAHWSGPGARS